MKHQIDRIIIHNLNGESDIIFVRSKDGKSFVIAGSESVGENNLDSEQIVSWHSGRKVL